MRNQFIQLTSGWIPVSVLVLFTIALIAGQARANLPNEIKAPPLPAMTTSINLVLDGRMVRKLESLPALIDALVALPSELEIRVHASVLSPSDSDEHSSKSKPK